MSTHDAKILMAALTHAPFWNLSRDPADLRVQLIHLIVSPRPPSDLPCSRAGGQADVTSKQTPSNDSACVHSFERRLVNFISVDDGKLAILCGASVWFPSV